MDEMMMPGGGPAWPGAATSFLEMWVAMMAAMMLPSLLPALWRYRRAVDSRGVTRSLGLTAQAALGYLSVWTTLGVAVFPVSVALSRVELRPIVAGVVVLAAGAVQLTAWKAHHLACFRMAPAHGAASLGIPGAAWRYGLRLGMHCSVSCAGPTAALLVVGVMDPRAMAVATAAVTAERLAPAGERVARAIGAIAIVAGSLLIARAVSLG